MREQEIVPHDLRGTSNSKADMNARITVWAFARGRHSCHCRTYGLLRSVIFFTTACRDRPGGTVSSCPLPAAPGAPARGGHRHNFSTWSAGPRSCKRRVAPTNTHGVKASASEGQRTDLSDLDLDLSGILSEPLGTLRVAPAAYAPRLPGCGRPAESNLFQLERRPCRSGSS